MKQNILNISFLSGFLALTVLPAYTYAQETADGSEPTETTSEAVPAEADIPVLEIPENSDTTECVEDVLYHNQILRAENAYIRRQYETVITIVNQIKSQNLCIEEPDLQLEMDIMLGVASLELGREEEANQHFLNVLKADPDHEIGSIITLPVESAQRLEDLKIEYAEELETLRNKGDEESRGVVVETLYVVVEKEKHQFWLNFVPFGAGQFQSGQIAAGATYASLQGVSLAMTILGASMVEYYRGDTFTFSPEDKAIAQKWQYVQIAGIAAFGAFYLASVIQGIVQHESVVTVMQPPSQQRPEQETAHYLSPFITEKGDAGLSYGMTF